MKKRFHIHPVITFYWRQARKYPKLLAGICATVPVSILVNNYLPALILADVLARLSEHRFDGHGVFGSFGTPLLLYFAVLITGILCWRIVDYFAWRLEWNVQQKMAEKVFAHMLDESADFHANRFGGSLVSQTNKLLGGYIRTADTTIFQVYPLFIGIIIVSVILLPRAPLYVLVLILATFAYLAFALWISRPVRRLATKFASAESKQTGYLADAITNVMVIKSFARKQYEKQRFHKATSETKQRLQDFSRLHRIQMNGLGVLSRTMSSLALVVAVVSVMLFDANIATVFLIFSYTSTIVDSLFQFSNNSLRNYSRAFGDAKDMVDILAQEPVVLDPKQPEALSIKDGSITFDHVHFTHTDADDALFSDLSLNIASGEKVGLVGHSGSGKTTFMRLLLRFSDIQQGAIRIGGQNIAHITQEDLHENIAYVPQEPLLFHRSISENIAYGKPSATQKEIEHMANLAHAHEFVKDLSQGYDTLVGERGVKLSGGQRQRVAIARAMIKDAPILVLDEATSALDSKSESLIQDALWKLMDGRTAIVIAHRLSTIQKMDRILVMDNGKIAEEGTHKQLIAKGGIYADLWAHQSGGFLEE